MRIKNTLLLLCFALLALPLMAQNAGLKITKVNIGFASEFERLSGLNANYLSSLSRENINGIYNLDQFEDHHLESMSCENPNLKIGLTFETALLPKFEIQAAVSFIKDRIDMTHYDNYEASQNYIYLENSVDEIGLDLALNRVFSAANFLKFYAGAVAALGYAYNGRLNIRADQHTMRDPDSAQDLGERSSNQVPDGEGFSTPDYGFEYRSKNALHARAFLQIGVGFVIRQRLELGFQARGGLGLRAQQNTPIKPSTLESSQINLSWTLRK